MIADSILLSLPHVSLKMKELLPEWGGIYYIVDETNKVWYIGKAKNIHKRWQGNTHHRMAQLETQKKKNFLIYYRQVNLNNLDFIEKQEIEKYHPHLNETKVETKKVRPTETRLRETLVAISDFSFIIGVEPEKKHIYLCFNVTHFQENFNIESAEGKKAIMKAIFISRKVYAQDWFISMFSPISVELLVYGYNVEIIELHRLKDDVLNNLQFKSLTLAQHPINALDQKSLIDVQNLYQDSVFLQKLEVYQEDLIPLMFNESIDQEKIKQNLLKISHDYQQGKRGVGSRSKPPVNIDDLLMSRGIEMSKYSSDDKRGITMMSGNDRIGLYIQPFSVNAQTPRQCRKNGVGKKFPVYNAAYGTIDGKSGSFGSSIFNQVYLLVSVDRKGWLLVENYLQGFAKAATQLNNGEGYCEKWYVSAKKSLVPAKVNIRLLEMGYSVWMPFGCCDEFPTFDLAKQEITRRLQNADLPTFKLTFTQEKTTQ